MAEKAKVEEPDAGNIYECDAISLELFPHGERRLIIDRLSILALRIYHTREEADRQNAPAGHTERNCERLSILEEQRADLAGCLDALWTETLAGTRRFKLYRQLKMYNDPSLNPAVYRKLVKEKV